MKTTPTLEIKSDLSAITGALAKLRAIADILPVTTANFVDGAGGIAGLVEQGFEMTSSVLATFSAWPNDRLQCFLDGFSDDDLACTSSADASLLSTALRQTVTASIASGEVHAADASAKDRPHHHS